MNPPPWPARAAEDEHRTVLHTTRRQRPRRRARGRAGVIAWAVGLFLSLAAWTTCGVLAINAATEHHQHLEALAYGLLATAALFAILGCVLELARRAAP